MKIGVMTFWNSNSNYGQIFQCWSLQQYLKESGHEPYVIKYAHSAYKSPLKLLIKRVLFIDTLKTVRKYLFSHKAYEDEKLIRQKDALRCFDDFRAGHLEFSPVTYRNIYELQQNPPEADAYVTGSDQVWAQMLDNVNSRAFFLDFGPESVRRIAYAPSFAIKEYPSVYRTQLRGFLDRFSNISVREMSGVEICRSVGVNAEKVLDPSFLLPRQRYAELIGEKVEKKQQIFVYSLNISDSSQIRWKELKDLASNKGMSVRITPSSGYFPGREIFGKEAEYCYPTPVQWLRMIAESALVVTPSFHGVVFSLILGVPFVYIPLSGKFESGNDRVNDLLKSLNLEDRALTESSSYEEIISRGIDFDSCHRLLDEQIEQSRRYLDESLRQ